MKTTRILAAAALTSLLILGGIPQRPSGHAAQVAGPVKGGTVIDGLYEEPDRLIPNTSSETYSVMVQYTIFAPLFYTDAKAKLHPGLAREIPTVGNGDISADGLSYTFKLRPGLKWSDGAPLDARDVDYSWKTWMNKDLIVNTTVGFDQIKSATISPDNLSITFHLKARYAAFISIWTDTVFPLPAHVLSKMTAKQLNTSKFTFMPTVSSGPFKMVARKAGYSITEVRNPNYYQAGKPYLDKLIFRIIPDQVAITNALRAGEIDSSWFLDVTQTETYKHIKGYTFVVGIAPSIEQALLNLKNPALKDVRVRQALEYGLDRPSMVKDVWKGTAILMASDQPPTLFSYNPRVKPYPFDPVKAGKLLDAAGWKLGADGRRHKNGKLLTLRYSTTARNPWRAQDELIALQSFQNLGIDLRIVNYPADTYFGHVLPSGNYDIGEFQNTFSYDPDPTIATAFRSDQLPPRGSNWGYYINPAYDKLIQAEESTADQAQRKAIFGKMQVIMNHDLPSLWLYDPPNLAMHRNMLHNYAPGPFSFETWNTWEWWKG